MLATAIFSTTIGKKCRKRARTATSCTSTFTPLQHIDKATFLPHHTCDHLIFWKASRAELLTAPGSRVVSAQGFIRNGLIHTGFLNSGSHLIFRTTRQRRARPNLYSRTLVADDLVTGGVLPMTGRTITRRMTITKYQGTAGVQYFALSPLAQECVS